MDHRHDGRFLRIDPLCAWLVSPLVAFARSVHLRNSELLLHNSTFNTGKIGEYVGSGMSEKSNMLFIFNKIGNLVRVKGLEPPHLAALGPKPSASTNSATPATGALLAKPLAGCEP